MFKEFDFTIITVVFNSVNFIENTLRNVREIKKEANVEYIIIDGGSDDGTVEIINNYKDTYNYFISEKDNGLYDAKNKGIVISNGRYISFLNSGDTLTLGVLEQIISHPDFLKNNIVFYGDMTADYLINSKHVRKKVYANHHFLFWDMKVNDPTLFIPKLSANKIKYDLFFEIGADYNFSILLKKSGLRFKKLKGIIAHMMENGISSNIQKSIEERAEIHKKYYGKIYSNKRKYITIAKIKIFNYHSKNEKN